MNVYGKSFCPFQFSSPQNKAHISRWFLCSHKSANVDHDQKSRPPSKMTKPNYEAKFTTTSFETSAAGPNHQKHEPASFKLMSPEMKHADPPHQLENSGKRKIECLSLQTDIKTKLHRSNIFSPSSKITKDKMIFRNTYGNKRNHGLAATTKLALHNAPCSLEKMKPFKACKSQPTRKVISFEKPNENSKWMAPVGAFFPKQSVGSVKRDPLQPLCSKENSDEQCSQLLKLKQFFSNLDEKPLAKAQLSGRPEEDYIPGRPAVRTYQKQELKNNKFLFDSYKEYRAALAGVSAPIPFRDFVKNHLLFCGNGSLFDGILDL